MITRQLPSVPARLRRRRTVSAVLEACHSPVRLICSCHGTATILQQFVAAEGRGDARVRLQEPCRVPSPGSTTKGTRSAWSAARGWRRPAQTTRVPTCRCRRRRRCRCRQPSGHCAGRQLRAATSAASTSVTEPLPAHLNLPCSTSLHKWRLQRRCTVRSWLPPPESASSIGCVQSSVCMHSTYGGTADSAGGVE